jgi:hypothetical protein
VHAQRLNNRVNGQADAAGNRPPGTVGTLGPLSCVRPGGDTPFRRAMMGGLGARRGGGGDGGGESFPRVDWVAVPQAWRARRPNRRRRRR